MKKAKKKTVSLPFSNNNNSNILIVGDWRKYVQFMRCSSVGCRPVQSSPVQPTTILNILVVNE